MVNGQADLTAAVDEQVLGIAVRATTTAPAMVPVVVDVALGGTPFAKASDPTVAKEAAPGEKRFHDEFQCSVERAEGP
jgi:hypothetical protein